MSILNYLSNQQRGRPLINANLRQKAGISAAEQRHINDSIANTTPSTKQRKAKHGIRYNFDDRLKIAKAARLTSPYRAAQKYKISPSTAKKYMNILNDYLKINVNANVNAIKPNDIPELAPKKSGRPIYVSKHLMRKAKATIFGMREAGLPVNNHVIAATLDGLLRLHSPKLLSVNGGHLNALKYAKSFRRTALNGFSFRKGTAKRRPNKLKQSEINKWRLTVNFMRNRYKIPRALIMNLDQTFSKYVNVGNATYNVAGANYVRVIGQDDKRGVTNVLAVAANGAFLKMQTIYGGKTIKCLPSNKALAENDGHLLDYNKTHWSDFRTSMNMANDVVLEYVWDTKNELSLEEEQMAILTNDGWHVHRDPDYRMVFTDENVITSICPFGATNLCNGLDVSVNKPFKDFMRGEFREYITEQYMEQKKQGVQDREIKYDFKLSTLKPKHLIWQLRAHQYISERPSIIINGMEKAIGMPAYNPSKERELLGISS